MKAMLWVTAMLCGGCEQASPPKEITVVLAETRFRLELALTSDQIQTGMMGRKSLEKDAGMLFAFADESRRHFWMKNCLIPLDVLFMDGQGRIVSIHTMSVPSEEEQENPPTYPSVYPARFAIELNAGRAAELGLRAGKVLKLPLEDLKRWAK